MQASSLTEAKIADRLAKLVHSGPINEFPESFFDRPPKPAAVLLPLLKENGAWHLLFIRRTEKDGDHHSGQVAFPGGAQEPEDAGLLSSALREAQEEVGLDPADVRILGRLNDYITISNFHVTPFVGIIPWPYNISPSPDEVERVFTMPLDWLANSENYRSESHPLPGWDKPISAIYYQKFDGELLWGVSARLTLHFLESLQLA